MAPGQVRREVLAQTGGRGPREVNGARVGHLAERQGAVERVGRGAQRVLTFN